MEAKEEQKMVLSYISIFLIVCALIVVRILFLMFIKDKSTKSRRFRETPAKTMIILGSGGHTAEMLRIVKLMDYNKYTPRIYVSASTDNISIDKVKYIESMKNDYKIMKITRSREVGQSYISSVWTTIVATLEAVILLWSEKPELILCNGPGTCVPLCIIAFIFKIFYVLDITTVFVESYCRVKTFSLTGIILYYFMDDIIIILLEIKYEKDKEKLLDSTEIIKVLEEIIQQIDKGILLGAPLPNKPLLLTSIATKINNYYNKFVRTFNTKKIEIDYSKVSQSLFPEFVQINRYNVPSMESFYKDIFIPKIPVIITDSMKHWNALNLWQDIDYLNKIAGSRTVPIEIGSRYTEEDWSQSLITFSEFLQSHIIKDTSQKVGYLAQHQLFDQIPELQNDIVIPDYCSFSDKEDVEAELPDINAWFGPAGTVSPLHFDIKNNLLCQVFGYKRIFLYNPSDSINLYPYDTKLLNNTAQVDPLKPDYSKWPNFKKAKGFMCYLGPGEMLYIPPKWWHHVTALTTSFSVSFWWT
ncbi:hypothetical protein M0802_013957 [Mischocyttarus mexicanus]|nr:hypothetical protein M0802_013957 [Mischocyttarus mexicanus]